LLRFDALFGEGSKALTTEDTADHRGWAALLYELIFMSMFCDEIAIRSAGRNKSKDSL